MTASEIRYLLTIINLEKNGAVRLSDIANHIGCSKPSVTRATDNLEFRGYIKKGSNVELTPKGREEGQKLTAIAHYLEKEILSRLAPSARAAQRDAIEIMGAISPCNLEKLYEISHNSAD